MPHLRSAPSLYIVKSDVLEKTEVTYIELSSATYKAFRRLSHPLTVTSTSSHSSSHGGERSRPRRRCRYDISLQPQQHSTYYLHTGSGIGRQVALAFSSRGISAIVCADINESAARKTAEECLALKPEGVPELATHPLQCDVTDEASVQRMVDETVRLCGRIDHFVNTAGVRCFFFFSLSPFHYLMHDENASLT